MAKPSVDVSIRQVLAADASANDGLKAKPVHDGAELPLKSADDGHSSASLDRGAKL